MANAALVQSAKDGYRQVRDKSIGLLVTAAGLTVIMALLLIVLYLFWVILPLFTSPSLHFLQQFSSSNQSSSVLLRLHDKAEFAYRLSDEGLFSFFTIASTTPLFEKKLIHHDEKITSLAYSNTQKDLWAVATSSGKIYLKQVHFLNDKKALKQASIELQDLASLSVSQYSIDAFHFAYTDDSLLFASVANGNLSISKWRQGQVLYQHNMTTSLDAKVQLSANGKRLYLLSDNQLFLYRIEAAQPVLQQQIQLSKQATDAAKDISLAPNGSLLVYLQNGHISLWIDVIKEGKQQLVLQSQLAESAKLSTTEFQRNILASLNNNNLSLWHLPSQTQYKMTIPKFTGEASNMAFSPTGNSLLIEQKGQWSLYQVNNPHAEININALWKKIWYQGEREPAFIWQSSLSQSDKKVSLIPLIFGSFKVALLTLIIATPVALGGAIYTGYFMPIQLRKWVKPTVELMQAFPSVILGFLASLCLAPWLEYHFLDFILFVFFAPFLFFLVAFAVGRLPIKWQKRMTPAKSLFLFILLILFVAFASFRLAEVLTLHYWQGDGQFFVSQILGLNIEQRNALVVALAMSFAIIPTIFTIAEDAIFSVPQHLRDASVALGATPWQTLQRVVLTTASPGILSALMLGGSRAVGETMIVLMATGNSPIIDWNPLVGLRSLAANIAVEMPESVLNSSHFRLLFLMAFLLFCFTFLCNTFAELLRERLRNKYSAL